MKKYRLLSLRAVLAVCILAAGEAWGRNEWLTARFAGGKAEPISTQALTSPLPPIAGLPPAQPGVVPPPAASAAIDITMSIVDDPAGDNNGGMQGQAGSEAQDKWERIVQHFADAIYEMTEGAHKIRKVRIFKKNRFAASSDILWNAKGYPHVVSGVGEPGGRVNMYKVFVGGTGTGADYDMMADEQGAGYTMAHEFGHYFYGVYEEYPESGVKTDVAVAPSVMSNQWKGKTDARWLNFSIKNSGGGDYQNSLLNRQHRIHGASAWETLVRPPSNDPRRGPLGRRVLYSELAAVAPTGSGTPVINLPDTAARSELNIIWAEKMLFEVAIDNSASMSGAPLANAKAAARLLVDRAELGQSRMGIIKFNTTASVVFPVTDLNTEADKTALKEAIDAITDTGATAIGDGAVLALSELQAAASAQDTSVVFLLSDGKTNSGSEPLEVIPSYQTAQVPIFTFAFGDEADGATLRAMSEQTGGKFYVSPTLLADITLAFQDAFFTAMSEAVLNEALITMLPRRSATTLVPVDLGIHKLNVSVVFNTGAATAELYNAKGVLVMPDQIIHTETATVQTYTAPVPLLGNWKLVTQNLSPTASTTVKFQMGGTPGPEALTLSAYSLAGAAVAFPAPVVVRARLEGARSVIGAYVTATATSPSSSTATFALKDDGKAPDERAGDGTYSGFYYYTETGSHAFNVTMDNRSKTAKFASSSAAYSATILGTAVKREASSSVGLAFSRSARFNVSTSGGKFTTSVRQLPVGTYAGVLGAETDHAHTGFLRMTLSANGGYSGKFFYGGLAVDLKGGLNGNGGDARTIARKGKDPLMLAVRVDALNGSDRMSGELTDGGLVIPFSLIRTFHPLTGIAPSPSPGVGRHTWLLLPELNTDPAMVPPGIGYATVSVASTGAATISGRLAEGSAFTCGTQLTRDGELPVYASLYSGLGSLFGTVDVAGAHELEGAVRWIKPARPTDALYKSGFNTVTRSLGSLYTPPARGAKALNLTSSAVSLLHGSLPQEAFSSFTFDAANRFVFTLPNVRGTKLALSASTGLLTGEFKHPVTNKVTKLYGGVIQNRKSGGGYFLGSSTGGAFEFGDTDAPATTSSYQAAGLPLAIPDNAPDPGLASQMTVAGHPGQIVKCVLNLQIAHTHRGDLRVTLISPAGTEVVVHNKTGGTLDNVEIAGLQVPEVYGQAASGIWRIKVQDFFGGDAGTLESWSLTLSSY